MMKLSFSTLGCPDWTFPEIFAVASDLHYDGIEIRGIADEIYAPRVTAFKKENIPSLKAKLSDAGLSIPILTSGAYLVGSGSKAEAEIMDYVTLAHALGVPYVRVLGEMTPEPSVPDADIDEIRRRYEAICRAAEPYSVTPLIETNGCLANSATMRKLMENTDAQNKGVLWDLHHPVRFYGESPHKTAENIGRHTKHVHIKDSVVGDDGNIKYVLTGCGSLPITECISELDKLGYDGFLSYEWVKRWSRDLADPAIAFYQYVEYMKGIINK
jgi:sugar phosphate isomerase/epimerase